MRIKSLDGLRGLAAVSVVLWHLRLAGAAWLDDGRALYNGQVAVFVFYTLSGLVLSLPYWRKGGDPWLVFVTRRYFRIYPFLIISLIVSFLGTGASPSEAARILLLCPSFTDMHGNPAIWTLIVELHMALVFPGLMWLARRYVWGLLLPAALCLVAGGVIDAPPSDNVLAPLRNDAIAIWFFVFGALLGGVELPLPVGLQRYKILAVITGAISFFLLGIDYENLPFGAERIILFMFFPVLLVVFSWKLDDFCFCGRAVPQFLGRISFPLYVIHHPVIIDRQIAGGNFDSVPYCIFILLVLFVGAHGLHRIVERPTIAMARRYAPGVLTLFGRPVAG